ncbi:DUF1326 domain-containing protein [Pseudonocardia sp.]|uniref:DUF1326 domain-containing protein n=1 Tax=Pseudonocardia sp. TaxID=60912 RepID=UPI003D107ECE
MTSTEVKHTYMLEGTLLEACECGVLCPCWIGENPDNGNCDSFNAYAIENGQIDGVDVSGLNIVKIARIPGNVLKEKSWICVYFVDERATAEQKEKLLALFNGALGGPLCDLAGLIGEVRGVYDAPIEHKVVNGEGSLVIPGRLESYMTPFKSAYGETTTLHDTVFSTIPGGPAWVSKATVHKVNIPEHDLVWEFEGRNAIQGTFRFEH